VNEGEYGGVILYSYKENLGMQSIEIVLRSGEKGGGRTMEGINLNKIYYKNLCKHHSVSSI
jgi:hypothetical protein